MQINSLAFKMQLYALHAKAKTRKPAFRNILLIKYSINIIVLQKRSVASFIASVGYEKYYKFLIYSKENTFNFKKISHEKSGKK